MSDFNGLAIVKSRELRPEDRVVLGEGITALNRRLVGRATAERVEQASIIDHASKAMTGSAEHAVVGPDVEWELAGALFELLAVVDPLLLKPDLRYA
jgi:hypothetical protein